MLLGEAERQLLGWLAVASLLPYALRSLSLPRVPRALLQLAVGDTSIRLMRHIISAKKQGKHTLCSQPDLLTNSEDAI